MDKHPGSTGARLFNNSYSYICEEDPDGFHIITRHHIIAKRKSMHEFLAWSTIVGLMTLICTLLSPIPSVAQGSGFIVTVLLCILSAAVIHGNRIEQGKPSLALFSSRAKTEELGTVVTVVPSASCPRPTLRGLRSFPLLNSVGFRCNTLQSHGLLLLEDDLLHLLAKGAKTDRLCAETVAVMPTLGVQLETCYRSGKVSRRFVPVGDILAAVINEAVTPFTCYSYLALVLRDERKLSLVFQGLRPPLDMLVPTWKSLCSAVSSKMLQ